jgi:LCP family protein required for cell wall assembly
LGRHIEPETRARRVSPLFKRIALIVGLVLIGFGAVLAGFSIVQKKSPMQVMLEPAQLFVQTPQQVFGKSNLLVLVEGLDYDYNSKDEEYSSEARSDVIKAINIDFDTKQVYMLDVGRDMEATLPNGEVTKINAAQSEGGINESRKVIAQFLGIPGFDKYVILRADSMKDIINAIDGVDVNVKDSDCLKNDECKNQSDLDYTDTWGHLYIHLKPGMQHLDGDNAVAYARFRHDWCSDPCRMMRQDDVITAMVQKLRNDKLNTILHAGDLIGVIQRNVTTDLTTPQLASLASYFIDFSPSDLHKAQINSTGDVTLADGGDATLPDKADLALKVQSMLVAPPAPTAPPDPAAIAAVAPSSVRVDVENGSGVAGAAHRVAEALKKQGFTIGDIGDAPSSDVALTEIHEHSPVAYAGARVRQSLPIAAQSATIVDESAQTSSSKTSSDVTIVVGKDLAASTVKL